MGRMRYHDTTGVDFGSMRLDGFALVAHLTRTKTSGPGKRVSVLKLIVSAGLPGGAGLAGNGMGRSRRGSRL